MKQFLPNNSLLSGAGIAALIAFSTWGTRSLAFTEETRLVGVNVGSTLSSAIRDFSNDGFELSDGTPLVFGDWYRSDWRDLRVTMMNEISRDFGVYWGFGTGERAEKYEIQPSIVVGFISQMNLSEQETVTFSALAILGGRLKEKPCTADFGTIGGVQKVNCRLAASPMRPSETLEYLLDEPPTDQIRVSIRYQFRF